MLHHIEIKTVLIKSFCDDINSNYSTTQKIWVSWKSARISATQLKVKCTYYIHSMQINIFQAYCTVYLNTAFNIH